MYVRALRPYPYILRTRFMPRWCDGTVRNHVPKGYVVRLSEQNGFDSDSIA